MIPAHAGRLSRLNLATLIRTRTAAAQVFAPACAAMHNAPVDRALLVGQLRLDVERRPVRSAVVLGQN